MGDRPNRGLYRGWGGGSSFLLIAVTSQVGEGLLEVGEHRGRCDTAVRRPERELTRTQVRVSRVSSEAGPSGSGFSPSVFSCIDAGRRLELLGVSLC